LATSASGNSGPTSSFDGSRSRTASSDSASRTSPFAATLASTTSFILRRRRRHQDDDLGLSLGDVVRQLDEPVGGDVHLDPDDVLQEEYLQPRAWRWTRRASGRVFQMVEALGHVRVSWAWAWAVSVTVGLAVTVTVTLTEVRCTQPSLRRAVNGDVGRGRGRGQPFQGAVFGIP
jgi:hypothetical protein